MFDVKNGYIQVHVTFLLNMFSFKQTFNTVIKKAGH